MFRVPKLHENEVISDSNLYYTYGEDMNFVCGENKMTDIDEWRKTGNDIHSITADPKFKDIDKYDFDIPEDSPALSVGFVPISIKDAGIRKKENKNG